MNEAIARGGSQKPQTGFRSRVFETQHFCVVGFDFVQLIHELHVVNPNNSKGEKKKKQTVEKPYQLLFPSKSFSPSNYGLPFYDDGKNTRVSELTECNRPVHRLYFIEVTTGEEWFEKEIGVTCVLF